VIPSGLFRIFLRTNRIYASGGAALLSNKSLKLKGRLSLAMCEAQIKPLLNLYRQQWRDLVGEL
jgi:hypothetical protein|tara:strand:- start:26797 stop:26988 length:192 start_codon:yes stop_codon:yes gene_type:complete